MRATNKTSQRLAAGSGRSTLKSKYKTINATIPDDKDPENISMEEALVLIAARIAYDESKSGKKTRKKSKK